VDKWLSGYVDTWLRSLIACMLCGWDYGIKEMKGSRDQVGDQVSKGSWDYGIGYNWVVGWCCRDARLCVLVEKL